ncbi:hypothetical protein [Bacillus sp. BHET2]|jgi:hypothetical protein|uniref:hypothetical protein n=1 Tax=Bacillus sp. BHET2 TaxID=2583818 RepID=UPI001486943E|nr:hypothetical protein [Bacillus sp. BHET2]
MNRKPIIKVSFCEESTEESSYFIKRLIEKIMIDQLDLSPKTKGTLLLSSQNMIEEEQ